MYHNLSVYKQYFRGSGILSLFLLSDRVQWHPRVFVFLEVGKQLVRLIHRNTIWMDKLSVSNTLLHPIFLGFPLSVRQIQSYHANSTQRGFNQGHSRYEATALPTNEQQPFNRFPVHEKKKRTRNWDSEKKGGVVGWGGVGLRLCSHFIFQK